MPNPVEDPELLAIEAELTTQARKEEHVVRQYRTIAGVFELFWREVGVRTNHALWRLDGPEKGVGSCNIDYWLAADLLCGIGFIRLMLQRDWKNKLTGGTRKYCPFFRVNEGCILGNLKSPRCLDHVDGEQGEEILQRFGFEVPDMREPLVRIQRGGINPADRVIEIKPEVNDEFVKATVDEWMERINYIRTFPILHPEEAAKIDPEAIMSTEPIPHLMIHEEDLSEKVD